MTQAPEKEKSSLSVLNREGDMKVEWEKNRPEQVAKAKATFEELTKEKGYSAFKTNRQGAKGEQIRQFDPNAEKIILVPQMQGG